MAVWLLGQPPKERAHWLILIPAILAFAVACIPTGDVLAKRWAARHLERQVLTALTAPELTPSPWAGIDTRLPSVGGHACLWLLQTPDVPAWKLEELAVTFPDSSGVATQLARQKKCPAGLLETLWGRAPQWRQKDDLRSLELAIVTHAACGEALLWRILRETPYTETRGAIVARLGPSRPGVHEEYLRVSAEDRDHFTRRLAARDPRLPPALMSKLAVDESAVVRDSLAGNPSLPFALLEKLNADTDMEVRHQVILRSEAPSEWREKFFREALESKRTDIRYAVVADDPDVSPATLARLANDESWGIREAVAKHPKTAPETVEKLATDSNDVVRSAAASRLK